MSESKNRQWILDARPVGNLTGKEFRWNETSIPKPADGQVLVRNLWLSFDPTQRGWMAQDSYMPMVRLGEVMRASASGRSSNCGILNSNRATSFKVGSDGRIILRLMAGASGVCVSYRLASRPIQP